MFGIKLENVICLKDVNKDLLGGIKHIKNGMKCDLKSRNNKVYLILKLKIKKKKKKIF